MPIPAILLLVAAVLPGVSFVLLWGMGRRLGEPLAGWVACGLMGASLVCSVAAMLFWINGGTDSNGLAWGYQVAPISWRWEWIAMSDAPRGLLLGVLVDSLTVVMFAMICLIGLLVQVYSLGAMSREPGYGRFFGMISLFCSSMMSLVLSPGLLQAFVFWEMLGVCSFLLIGFWWDRNLAVQASAKALLMNRVGDVCLLLAVVMVVTRFGDLPFEELWARAGELDAGFLTGIGLLAFVAICAKCAQIPLHTWLADAMEAPTPVSALIHAATMVTAGVFLGARLYPLLTPDLRLLMCLTGMIGVIVGSVLAAREYDLKRLLAHSTMSHLGLMLLALGIGSWIGALFHLLTHGLVKALLFLAAGSVIHAARGEKSLLRLGGLGRKLPITASAFGLGVISLIGVPGFAGAQSKDILMDHTRGWVGLWIDAGRGRLPEMIPWAMGVASVLGAFALTRAWIGVFLGRRRNDSLVAGAQETTGMWIVFPVLMIVAIIGGRGLNAGDFLVAAVREGATAARGLDGSGEAFERVWRIELYRDVPEEVEGDLEPLALSGAATPRPAMADLLWKWGWGLGVLGALVRGGPGAAVPERRGAEAVDDPGGFDLLYDAIVVKPVLATSRVAAAVEVELVQPGCEGSAGAVSGAAWVARKVEERLIDAGTVQAAAAGLAAGEMVRVSPSGRLRSSMLVLMLLVAAAAACVATWYFLPAAEQVR
jgi:proton-translocating NADH-quinone oxidoreductase chain L